MKAFLIAGIVLIALGAFILVTSPSYRSGHSVMRVGDLEVSAEGRRGVPPWVGWAAVIGGVALAGTGLARKRST